MSVVIFGASDISLYLDRMAGLVNIKVCKNLTLWVLSLKVQSIVPYLHKNIKSTKTSS